MNCLMSLETEVLSFLANALNFSFFFQFYTDCRGLCVLLHCDFYMNLEIM